MLQEYVLRIDPVTNLGLSAESVHSYHIGDIVRSKDCEVPELLPVGYLVGDTMQIGICLKGMMNVCVMETIDLLTTLLTPVPTVFKHLTAAYSKRCLALLKYYWPILGLDHVGKKLHRLDWQVNIEEWPDKLNLLNWYIVSMPTSQYQCNVKK